MSFSVYDSEVALCSGENVVIHNLENDTESVIILPKLEMKKDAILHNNLDIESFHTITDISFSNDGQYFLVCTNRKQLCLYKRESRELVSNRTLTRAASKVRFCPNNDIAVADKSGDAYVFSTSKPQEEGTMLLGHLSMLLDVLISENQRYILTSDRDEKIRVSMYPNCHNIASYCLGHEKFVTNISELPHANSILVSSGGDGFLRFWDYVVGREVLSINVSKNVDEEDIRRFNESLQDCELEETVVVLPIKQLSLARLNDSTSLVATTLHSSSKIYIYSISGNMDNALKSTLQHTINLDEEPLECIVQNNSLWVLSNQRLTVYELNQKQFVKNDSLNHKLKKLNESWRTLRANVNKQTLIPILYKRKFDNVQEYRERKKSRLAKVIE